MSDLVHPVLRESRRVELRGSGERIPLLSLLPKDLASNGPAWLPVALALVAIAGVAYADHLVVSLSLVYLYTLPLTVGAVFLRKEISYGLLVACIAFHYYFHYFDSPRHIHLGLRIFHDLSALLCLTFVVYVIQRYIERQESLVKIVERQRDSLLKDVELAAEVQRLFLPSRKPAIAGLEIAGMMQPARGVGGDYYDYFPIDAHTIQIVIAAKVCSSVIDIGYEILGRKCRTAANCLGKAFHTEFFAKSIFGLGASIGVENQDIASHKVFRG